MTDYEAIISDILDAKNAIRNVIYKWRGKGLTKETDEYLGNGMIQMDEAVGIMGDLQEQEETRHVKQGHIKQNHDPVKQQEAGQR